MLIVFMPIIVVPFILLIILILGKKKIIDLDASFKGNRYSGVFFISITCFLNFAFPLILFLWVVIDISQFQLCQYHPAMTQQGIYSFSP